MAQPFDTSRWARKEIFDFFSTMSNPYYMVTFRQDVTKVYAYAKEHRLSFYHSLIYLCTQAVNRIPAFLLTIRQGEVFRLDSRAPSFTDLHPGSEAFHIVTLPCRGSIAEFDAAATAKSAAQRVFLESAAESDELIYFSCLPWVDLTAVTNERDLAAPGSQEESIPHIAWGKYTRRGDRLELGISLEVNHRLIDGFHIGQFAEALTAGIEAL